MSEFVKRPIKKSKSPLIDDECIKYLNYRIQQEELSSRIYLSMSMYLNNEGYTGAATLWKKYSEEELIHADWSRDYLLAMGVTPETPALAVQPSTYTGLPEIIKMSYDHEIEVTKQIKEMASHFLKKGDHMAYELCLRYLKEQVEEMEKVTNLMDILFTFGESKEQLFMLDNKLENLAK